MAEPRPILILVPTAFESKSMFGICYSRPVEEPGCRGLRRGVIAEQPVLMAVCGVGKTSAAFTAAMLLTRFPCRALVNVGCAGAFPGTGLGVGDVVVAEKEVFADEGSITPEGFLDLLDLGIPGAEPGKETGNVVPITPLHEYSPRDLSNLAAYSRHRLKRGTLCTVSTCSGTDRRAAEVAERWGPLAESMEGAALAFAALRFNLPFLEVRGISNIAGDRKREGWDVGIAAAHAAAAAWHLILGPGNWPEPDPSHGQFTELQ